MKKEYVFITDLIQENSKYCLAHGGEGGKGNHNLKQLKHRNAVRKLDDLIGKRGENFEYFLELKSIADIGLVGYPNAGKSSLLSALTTSKPIIKNYPFTTLIPTIGNIQYQNNKVITMADIPGIMSGSTDNTNGLGIEFIRHIERTKFLLYVIDMSGCDGRRPIDDFIDIKVYIYIIN